MSYAEDAEDAPCTVCEKRVHLHNEPPCACGDVYCDFHACPVCSGELTIYADMIQGTDEWHKARRGMVTASIVGGLITTRSLLAADNDTSRGITALLVAERITGHTDPTYTSDDMLRGINDEPVARDVYSGNHAAVEECGFMVKTWPAFTIGYSPDGLVGDDGLIEVKSRRQKKHLQTILADKVPVENVAQCQCALLVSGRKWCDYVSFCGGMPLYVKRVFPDPDWFEAICNAAEAFEITAAHMADEYALKTRNLPATERTDYMEMVI